MAALIRTEFQNFVKELSLFVHKSTLMPLHFELSHILHSHELVAVFQVDQILLPV